MPKPKVISTAKPPTIILVHGFRGAPLGLYAVRDELIKLGYNDVHVPPIPPFAGATPLSTYTPDTYAKYLADYCKTHHLERPVLIGHSMGSIIVAATLQKYPDLFHKKSILLSPISTRTALPFRLISPLSSLIPASLIDYITTKFLIIDKSPTEFKRILSLTRDCSHDQPPNKKSLYHATKFSTYYAVADFKSHHDFLFLAGAKDRLIPKQDTLKLAQDFDAKAIFLPNTGHIHTYEQPAETAQAIADFLQAE